MFAGAAREAVFSNPTVIETINQNYIPVALKARNMNRPPLGIEGRIYQQLKRTSPAPQGIAIMNSAGKPLCWSLMFDNDQEIPKYFDYGLKLYQETPDSNIEATRRFQRYPSEPLRDIPSDDEKLVIPPGHENGEACPGIITSQNGAVLTRVVGRATNESSILKQENYVEDRFEISTELQELFIKSAGEHESAKGFELPQSLAHLLASNAYLGCLDMNPLGGAQIRAQTDLSTINLHAKIDPADPTLFQITGSTHVKGSADRKGVSHDWEHEVILEWYGFFQISDQQITRIVLNAAGSERIYWPAGSSENPAASLPGGSPIKLSTGVRYGFIGSR